MEVDAGAEFCHFFSFFLSSDRVGIVVVWCGGVVRFGNGMGRIFKVFGRLFREQICGDLDMVQRIHM